MLFTNKSKNTIFLSDIEMYVPFLEGEESKQEISLENAKKSSDFRRFISFGQLFITDCGNSIFEKNLLLRQKTAENMIQKKGEDMPLSFIKSNENVDKNKIEVKLRGHFYEHGGYAKVNRNLAIGLNQVGVKVQIDSVNDTKSQLSEEETRQITKLKSPVSKNAIVIESIIPTFSCMGAGKYKILYTTIEAETIPKQFIDIASAYNEVWVNSDFAKKVLTQNGFNRPVFIFPNIIDNKHYVEDCEPYKFSPSLKDFVFVSVFGWSYRKGYDALLKAYLSAFDGDDNVSLLIVSRNHLGMSKDDVIKNTIQKYISEYGGENPAHIARYSKAIPEKVMPNIYKACNAFVLFTRGESFGNPYCEASLCGLPVIATRCSGQMMYLNEGNSFLVDIDASAPMSAGQMQVHYWDEQVFPLLTSQNFISSASKKMRYVYKNIDKAKKKNEALKAFISDKYDIDKVSLDVKERLQAIWNKMK